MVVMTPTRFTRRDYEQLPEGFPAQLIDGQLVKKPTPPVLHQRVVGDLLSSIARGLGRDQVLHGPLDVFIDDENVFQADLVVFAEPRRWRPEDTDVGVPDVVIEVLSSCTADLDRGVKARRYLEKGVREIWIVDPVGRSIDVRTTEGSVVARDGQTVRSGVIEGFELEVADLHRG